MTSVLNFTEGAWGRSTVYKDKEIKKSMEIVNESDPRLQSLEIPFEDSDDEEKEFSTGEGSVEIELNAYILPYIFSSLFATILEDTATQLQILVEGSNEIKIIKTKSDWELLERNKFSVQEPESVDELDKIDPKYLGRNEYKINKLDSDRIYVIDVIKKTYVDLSLKKSFNALGDSVNAILAEKKYRITLAEEETKNRLLRRELGRQLRQLRNHIKSVLYDTDVKIDELVSKVEDVVLVSECRSRYVLSWELARTEQHDDTIHDTESDYTNSIEYFKKRTDHEHRVHMEVEMLNNIAINDTLQKVENIMGKYDVDMESVDLKIQIQKNDYQNMMDKRIALQKIIDEHEKQMSEWVYFKDEREKARLYREKMNNAAITVQAWWRGLLVRRQLGPYKPSKRRGAAPAAPEGKKKKK